MKRCIICGNTGDDSSTVCSVCGNPYVDMSDSFGEDFEENLQEENQSADQKEDPAAGRQLQKRRSRQERRRRKRRRAARSLGKENGGTRLPIRRKRQSRKRTAGSGEEGIRNSSRTAGSPESGQTGQSHRSSAGPQIYGQGEADPYSQGRTRQAAGRPGRRSSFRSGKGSGQAAPGR